MAKIMNAEMGRGPSSSVLTLRFSVRFSEVERDMGLKYYVRAALYDRDQTLDKFFFWTNGSTTSVHSVARGDRDDFISFFPSQTIQSGDGNADIVMEMDLDSPELADRLRRADDPLPDPPFLGVERMEELRAMITVYNDLAPATWISSEHSQTDVDPDG